MKYCAVICELNPFHSGHEYILRRAREVSGCDRVIALMSGAFVQRALPACLDARSRAECALRYGADMVIELPVIYSSASGEVFAKGAIGILDTLPEITHLVMGAENADKALFERIARVRVNENEEFSEAIGRGLSGGLSYARALTAAVCRHAGGDPIETERALTCPNNILAAAYASALLARGSKIEFTPVARAHDPEKYASASELRADEGTETAERFMPPVAREIWLNRRPKDVMRHYGTLLLYALRTRYAEEIASTPDCAEGFENKLKSLSRSCRNFDELLRTVPTSRFTRGRIMRICLHNLLGISRDMQKSGYVCAKLTGIRAEAKDMLSLLPQNIIVNKQGESAIPSGQMNCFEADRRASDLWALLAERRCDFYSRLLVV